jgi:hypothetical protein
MEEIRSLGDPGEQVGLHRLCIARALSVPEKSTDVHFFHILGVLGVVEGVMGVVEGVMGVVGVMGVLGIMGGGWGGPPHLQLELLPAK